MQYAVIMAGGAGTRLWPAARQALPKQLHSLIFERPLIAETVERLAQIYDRDRIIIVTAKRYVEPIQSLLPELPLGNIIGEPFGRNTAAAIALAALRIASEDRDDVFAVFPADHVILKPQALFDALRFAGELALEHRVVDIGVPPSHPETGYGYIELGMEVEQRNELRAYEVKRFVEKPDLAHAQEYVESGNYMWNSGMFIWRAGEYLDALRDHLPDTESRLARAFESGQQSQLDDAYASIEDISVDYAIMEKASDVVALPVDFGWRDIGDWAALYDMMEHDAEGNAFGGAHMAIDAHDCLFIGDDKLIAAVGVSDLIVVSSGDAVLVIPRDRAQEVKQILSRLKERGQERYL